jgi:LuxR family maltose regulon positive regulatory protein
VSGPLLETKLHTPRRRGTAVARQRLAELLDRSCDASLTLVAGRPVSARRP